MNSSYNYGNVRTPSSKAATDNEEYDYYTAETRQPRSPECSSVADNVTDTATYNYTMQNHALD